MLLGLVVIVLLSSALSAVLIFAESRWKADETSLVDQVEELLPRIHCAQCGFPGCRPYAQALATGAAQPDLCPPGGPETALALASLLGVDRSSLRLPEGSATTSQVARIDEAICIGCNLCQRACPVDAIAGVPQMMHTVISAHCTGCELCLAPCPVDCIDLVRRA